MMPVTWKGSRKYMQKAYSDLMTIVRYKGKAALFVTFTGNQKWPKIIEALPRAFERSDIVREDP